MSVTRTTGNVKENKLHPSQIAKLMQDLFEEWRNGNSSIPPAHAVVAEIGSTHKKWICFFADKKQSQPYPEIYLKEFEDWLIRTKKLQNFEYPTQMDIQFSALQISLTPRLEEDLNRILAEKKERLTASAPQAQPVSLPSNPTSNASVAPAEKKQLTHKDIENFLLDAFARYNEVSIITLPRFQFLQNAETNETYICFLKAKRDESYSPTALLERFIGEVAKELHCDIQFHHEAKKTTHPYRNFLRIKLTDKLQAALLAHSISSMQNRQPNPALISNVNVDAEDELYELNATQVAQQASIAVNAPTNPATIIPIPPNQVVATDNNSLRHPQSVNFQQPLPPHTSRVGIYSQATQTPAHQEIKKLDQFNNFEIVSALIKLENEISPAKRMAFNIVRDANSNITKIEICDLDGKKYDKRGPISQLQKALEKQLNNTLKFNWSAEPNVLDSIECDTVFKVYFSAHLSTYLANQPKPSSYQRK